MSSRPRSPRPGRGLAAAIALASLAAAWAPPAQAEASVTLIRTYDSNRPGVVFEVCRGRYEAPATDPQNPAYCRGEVLYWSQRRWQAHNRRADASPPGAGKPQGKSKAKAQPGAGQPGVAVGQAPGAEAPPAAIPYGGSLDPSAVLGLENPMCGAPGQLSAAQVRNCRASSSPEAAYPTGNYGWDIHIEEGGYISSLFVPAVSFVLQLLSALWLILLLILKGALIVMAFALELSPFTDNKMLREIDLGLSSFFNGLTSPWMRTLMVILGAWGLYNGIIRRRAAETLGGMLAALVMMLGAMWVIHSPRDTVGRVAGAVNSASLSAVSAPTSGSTRAPARSYNDAMTSVWNQMTSIPFCAMNFSDVKWCMTARPSPEALEAAKGGLDFGDAYTRQILAGLPEDRDKAARSLERLLGVLFGPAPTIRDLYLRFSPAGGPRDALWEHYHGKPDDHVGLPLQIGPQVNVGGGSSGAAPEMVEMQGRGGVLARIVMLVFFLLGLAGGLALLLWIAMRLMMASAAAFLLVLATPLAMFMPVFGQAGRTAFVKWLTSLLGAVAAKLIFSGLLGVVLLGSRVIGQGVGGSSPTLGLIATMAFWWSAFLSREKFLALFQIDPIRDDSPGIYRAMAGGYLGYRVARAAKNAISTRRSERREQKQHREAERSRSGRDAGEQTLDRQAQERLDVSTRNAEAREAGNGRREREARALREDPDVRALRHDGHSLDEDGRARAEHKAARLREVEGEIRAARPQEQADRQLLTRVRANEAAGLPAHGRGELEGAKDALRRESTLPPGAREHRWRAQAAGADPDKPAGRQAIEQSLAASRSAIGATSHQRLDQVDLRRPRRANGGQRQASSGLRRPDPTAPPTAPAPRNPSEQPRPRRRLRMRDWLSR